jgi:hypothetical protein
MKGQKNTEIRSPPNLDRQNQTSEKETAKYAKYAKTRKVRRQFAYSAYFAVKELKPFCVRFCEGRSETNSNRMENQKRVFLRVWSSFLTKLPRRCFAR